MACENYLRGLLLVGVFMLGILGIVASGGSSGGGGDDVNVSFPTPTLPAGAVRLDNMNATEIAEEAVLFISLLSSFADFKTEAPPSSAIEDVIKRTVEYLNQRDRGSPSVAARTDDLSAFFCPNGGSAIVNSSESGDTLQGTIDLTDCNLDLVIMINGSLSFISSENFTTLDYALRIGGTLTLSDGINPDAVFVLDFDNSGNDGTTDFSLTTDFSVDGRPGGGYLVTTIQPIVGNFFSFVYFSGQLIVDGADDTQLRITVVPGNMADVELDDGLGGPFVIVPPPIALPPL